MLISNATGEAVIARSGLGARGFALA